MSRTRTRTRTRTARMPIGVLPPPVWNESGAFPLRWGAANRGTSNGATMTDLGFDGKVAIVTGAGGGLGREHSRLLGSRGALVVVNDIGGAVDGTGGDAGPAQKVVDEIRAAGGEAVADTNSVATPDGGRAIVQTALDAFGRVDIVVNNAGILRDKSFHNMTPDLVDPVIDVHLRGAFYVTQPAWVHMREQQYGRVIVTASSAGIYGNFGQANYGAAKMGLVGLAHVLAQEGERYNIKANVIAPVAGTRMTREIFGDLADKLDPALVSPVVAWLAHEDCPVSGHTYSVAAGRVARIFVGVGPGYMRSDAPLTAEDVRDHFDEIERTDDFVIMKNATEELRLVAKLLG
jgi:NAD(P)-dependent dehydrogenase (short-subunit alcohol dehydrogenase family)